MLDRDDLGRLGWSYVWTFSLLMTQWTLAESVVAGQQYADPLPGPVPSVTGMSAPVVWSVWRLAATVRAGRRAGRGRR